MLAPDQMKIIESMVRLELGGSMPPGYELQALDNGGWGWLYKGPDGQSQQSCGPVEDQAKASAWWRFWRAQVGKMPPGYSVAEEEAGGSGEKWIWIIAEEKIRSFPKASREEAEIEAWVDFKAIAISVKRPPHQEAGDDPRAIMARFQQVAFQQVAVKSQLEQLENQEKALDRQLRTLVNEFNKSMAKYAKTEGIGGGQG